MTPADRRAAFDYLYAKKPNIHERRWLEGQSNPAMPEELRSLAELLCRHREASIPPATPSGRDGGAPRRAPGSVSAPGEREDAPTDAAVKRGRFA